MLVGEKAIAKDITGASYYVTDLFNSSENDDKFYYDGTASGALYSRMADYSSINGKEFIIKRALDLEWKLKRKIIYELYNESIGTVYCKNIFGAIPSLEIISRATPPTREERFCYKFHRSEYSNYSLVMISSDIIETYFKDGLLKPHTVALWRIIENGEKKDYLSLSVAVDGYYYSSGGGEIKFDDGTVHEIDNHDIEFKHATFSDRREVEVDLRGKIKTKLLDRRVKSYRINDSLVELDSFQGDKLKTMFNCLVNKTYKTVEHY